MAKYDPLREHLRGQRADMVPMSFEQVGTLVPGGLPASAYSYSAWWANEQAGTHSHARAWRDAGFRTAELSLSTRRVTFVRDVTARQA